MPPEAEIRPEHAQRLRFASVVIGGLLLVLLGGLSYWQLYRAPEVKVEAKRQSHRRVMEPGPRGRILDREGRVLAESRPVVSAVVNLGELRAEFQRTQRSAAAPTSAAETRRSVVQHHLDQLNTLTGRHDGLDSAALERAYAKDRATPFPLSTDLTETEAAKLSAALEAANPIALHRSFRRSYPNGRTAAHVLGRVRSEQIRPPRETEIVTLPYFDAVGDFGIEKQYDARLRSRPGETTKQIDAAGFLVGPSEKKNEPASGSDITLSLDLDLQQAVERTLAAASARRGAAVVLEVATGEVLALASKPDFDLNTVALVIAPAVKQQIDTEGGWLNRATQALYPPGSSFKVFTALAGLRRGTLHPADVLHCDGFHQVGDRRFPCHNPAGHGDLMLREALSHSCNVFFYQVGLAAGAEALAAETRRFHFDLPTGIDLPAETNQMLVPDPAWKQSRGDGAWTPGDTANLAIGQGYLRYSPLQAAGAMASLARRETLTVPTVLHQPGRSPTGEKTAEPLGISASDYGALVAGLQAVVESGIGREAQVPGIRIAGKTGTAQIQRPEGMQNIAWFIAFAPAEKPEIALAVALEGDQPNVEFAGAAHAAPAAGEIMAAYFERRGK